MNRIYILLAFMVISIISNAQDWANLSRYRQENKELYANSKTNEKRIVFMGNSITEQWEKKSPGFFAENGYICRGISGQTTPQMLIRFRQDVVNIGAEIVIILAGTNDIAGMCDIAKQNKIKVILCSVLPVKQYSWKKNVRPDLEIPKLNAMLKEYAIKNKITYVDFFTHMVDNTPENENGLIHSLTNDGVHLTPKGYEIMEQIIVKHLK